MSIAQALDAALAAGISYHSDGNKLVLKASRKPPTAVLDLLRRHKAQILALMRPIGDEWSSDDWRAFFDERAGIATFDGGQTQMEGEANAFECCIAEWLNRHPAASDSERCFWCGKPEQDRHIVVPFGTKSQNHTWLHSACWPNWYRYRRETAIEALARLGIRPGTQAREIEPVSLVRSQVGFSKPIDKNQGDAERWPNGEVCSALNVSVEGARFELCRIWLMAGRWRRRLYGACGAATKSKGAPCRATAVKPGGRCKWHGGLSTGPKTPAGKARSADNLRRWRQRQRAKTEDNVTNDEG